MAPIAGATGGDGEAFSDLHSRYQKQIFGFIRPRAHRGDDAQDIEQEAWLLIWKKMPTYDPARASFLAFAKYWADIARRRYYAYQKKTNWLQTLLHDLLDQLIDQDSNPEIEKVRTLLTAESGDTISDDKASLYLEGFAKLSSLTVGKCTLPHQVIAIGFVTLLGMKSLRVIDDLADVSLADSAKRLEERYVKRAKLVPKQDSSHLQPLHDKLKKPFAEVATAKDLKIYPKADFEHLYAGVVGATTLRDYNKGPKINTEGLGRSSTPDEVMDRSPTPDAVLDMIEEHEQRLRNDEKLLRLTFGSCSPPHQLIALGFVKLLEMKPKQVVEDLSHTPLMELATRFENDYVRRSQLPPERIRPHLQPFYKKLEKRFPEIVTEKKTLNTYPQEQFSRLYDRPSGDTTLGDYRTGGLEDNISKWCGSVMLRVGKKWLQEEVDPSVQVTSWSCEHSYEK